MYEQLINDTKYVDELLKEVDKRIGIQFLIVKQVIS